MIKKKEWGKVLFTTAIHLPMHSHIENHALKIWNILAIIKIKQGKKYNFN